MRPAAFSRPATASGIAGAAVGLVDTRAPTAPGATAPGIVGLFNSGIINPFSLTQTDAALAGLKRHTGRMLWLNPMLRFEGYQPLARGARVLNRQVDAMLPVHNLDSLQSLAHSLQRLLPHKP